MLQVVSLVLIDELCSHTQDLHQGYIGLREQDAGKQLKMLDTSAFLCIT